MRMKTFFRLYINQNKHCLLVIPRVSDDGKCLLNLKSCASNHTVILVELILRGFLGFLVNPTFQYTESLFETYVGQSSG
jgi:hypothetical protein